MIASFIILAIVRGGANDRYEPLPGFFELPGFLWRKLPRVGRVGLVAVGLALVGLVIALSPTIERSKEEHARAEATAEARFEKQQVAATRREQRPRFARGTPGGTDRAARRRLVTSAAASIKADASTRSAAGEFKGPILRVACDPYPPTAAGTPADSVPSMRSGRYECLAITSDVPPSERNMRGVVGYPYRTKIDFRTGRYAFCKVRGRPAELAIRASSGVPLARVCGG
jgi:hypothetical protein